MDHESDLVFFRGAVSGDGFFDCCGGVFGGVDGGAGEGDETCRAGVSEFERGLDAFSDEGAFHGGFIGLFVADDRGEIFGDMEESWGEFMLGFGSDCSVGDVLDFSVFAQGDDSPSCGLESWVQP